MELEVQYFVQKWKPLVLIRSQKENTNLKTSDNGALQSVYVFFYFVHVLNMIL